MMTIITIKALSIAHIYRPINIKKNKHANKCINIYTHTYTLMHRKKNSHANIHTQAYL